MPQEWHKEIAKRQKKKKKKESGIVGSCGIGCRCGSDPMWLWLWFRLAAVAPIHPLAWNLLMPWVQPSKDKKTKKKCCFLLIAMLGIQLSALDPQAGWPVTQTWC